MMCPYTMVLGGLLPSTPVVNVVVLLVATGFIWFGSGWLEESAEQLSVYYGLPAVVQELVVVAVEASFPESLFCDIAEPRDNERFRC